MNNKNYCNNRYSYIPLHINKIDSASGIGISGAVFELIACNNFIFSGTTDSNGSLIFKLFPCTAYRLKEIAPPDGYLPTNHIYNIFVDVCGCIFVDSVLTSQIIISNTPITASFTAIKVNIENSMPLAGAVYTLFMNSIVIASATSNAKGQVSFTNLSSGLYELVETIPSPGFQVNTERLAVVVGQNGSVTINGWPANGFILNNVPLSEFAFLKLDASTGLPLAGATFTLTQNSTLIGTTTSGADGLINFGTLTAGKYQLIETVVPPGFQPNGAIYQVVVGMDGSITVDGVPFGEFVVVNIPIAISAPPIINTIIEGDVVITGAGVPGSSIAVTLPSSSELNTTVNTSGTWAVNVPVGVTLAAGDIVSANQTEVGKIVSSDVTTIVIENTDIEPDIDTFVENLSTGLNSAQPGDVLLYDAIVSNNGTPSSIWRSAYVIFSLSSVVAIQVNSIRINNRAVTSDQYSYDSAANTLTIYLGDIPGGGGVSISYRVTVNSAIADINEIILDVTLGSLIRKTS